MKNVKFDKEFISYNLKLARLISGLTLSDVADNVGKSKQYIHQLETGVKAPTDDLLEMLGTLLHVNPKFFLMSHSSILDDESVHFRSNRTAKQASRLKAKASIDLFMRLIRLLEDYLTFPMVDFPSMEKIIETAGDVECAAENSRKYWQLGLGPISNMTRLVERSGAVVTFFQGVSSDVDALSSVVRRPIIVRNDAKDSPGRLRFDIAHELGHIVMHQGIQTGCKLTESQANRFASAFLLPRAAFIKEFRAGVRMDWRMLSELKGRWGVSKAALLYRARQLDLLTEAKYTSHIITLRKYEAKKEKDDYLVPMERSELIVNAIKSYLSAYNKTVDDLLEELLVEDVVLNQILDFDINSLRAIEAPHSNVIPFSRFRT
ncbi:helix-turn-helix domain-containing protein [Rahnella contaminans]|uniref:helix-turn-helix domain-containing protein n=1 Tax=Rahnella contaminans TaxID=2703882 RepID=UPI0023DA4501|nr:XRE family transcriptional regulator [Rahnella contaminans]MDF1895555.1 XRE family transcriptional regulator [Rahnella contaminans]